jgi:hypothetical protein
MNGNGLGYEYLLGSTLNFASKHQADSPRGFSEAGGN